MSAEALGRDLLVEVKEDSLDKLLQSLRAWNAPADRYHVGIAALDRLIEVFSPNVKRQQNHTGEQWHEPSLDTFADLRPPVIELTSAAPSSGKTQLLHHIIARTLLPKTYESIRLGGKEAAVALLDLSSSYSISRLGSMLDNELSASQSDQGNGIDTHQSMILDCLKHLHIFRPQTHNSLIATIDNLSSYFLSDTTSHYSANRSLGVVVINNLSAFFWQDRQDAEELRDAVLEQPEQRALNEEVDIFSKRYSMLVNSLSKAQHLFDCPIVATNWALAAPSRTGDGSSLRSHLPGAWNRFRTFNIVLQRNAVTKFGPGISVEEMLAEKQQRQEAVNRNGFAGWVNWWDSEVWKENLKAMVRAWEKCGGLRYHVTAKGVAFEAAESMA